jgi:hypothetical protein
VLEGQHEGVDVVGDAVLDEGGPDVERDVADHRRGEARVLDRAQRLGGVGVRGPLQRVGQAFVQRDRVVVVAYPGLPEDLHVGLAMQRRVEVPVLPRVPMLLVEVGDVPRWHGHPFGQLGAHIGGERCAVGADECVEP